MDDLLARLFELYADKPLPTLASAPVWVVWEMWDVEQVEAA